MKTPIYILYAEGHRKRGSVTMRALQLSEIGSYYLGRRFSFETLGLPRKGNGGQLARVLGVQGGVVILQKALAEHIDPEAFDHLKRRNIAVMVDWIDKMPRSPFMDDIDIHLAASRRQEQDLRARLPDRSVRHLTHHADLRLPPQAAQSFRALYFGHASNAALLDHLDLKVADIRTEQDFLGHVRSIADYSFHYAVRDDAVRDGIFKPFTKGFTAAACEANIIVQRDAHDVLHYLEADYPYLVADTQTSSIQTVFDYARESFGGPDWEYGLDVMADVRDRTCPRAVARELGGILLEVVGRRVTASLGRAA